MDETNFHKWKRGIVLKRILPVGVFLLGIVGAILRSVELTTLIDPTTNLYSGTGLFTIALPVLSLVAAILAVLCGYRFVKEKIDSYQSVFTVRNTAAFLCLICSACILTIAGVGKIFSVTYNPSIAQLLYGIITVLAGLSLIHLARCRKSGDTNEYTRFVSTIPVFWACFLVILTFMEHPVEPVLQIFAYDLLASCAIVLAVYYSCAFLFQKLHLSMPIISSLLAIYFILVSFGGRVLAVITTRQLSYMLDAPFRMLVFVAMLLYISVNLSVILKVHKN